MRIIMRHKKSEFWEDNKFLLDVQTVKRSDDSHWNLPIQQDTAAAGGSRQYVEPQLGTSHTNKNLCKYAACGEKAEQSRCDKAVHLRNSAIQLYAGVCWITSHITKPLSTIYIFSPCKAASGLVTPECLSLNLLQKLWFVRSTRSWNQE